MPFFSVKQDRDTVEYKKKKVLIVLIDVFSFALFFLCIGPNDICELI